MNWTALVPLKPPEARKTRMAERLSQNERVALSEKLFAHVVGVLAQHPAIERVVVLAPEKPAAWTGVWVVDAGRGLNGELEAARRSLAPGPLLIVHADLPLLSPADLDALLAGAAAQGVAIAPDRHGTGTNALALAAERMLVFSFGADSFRHHADQAPDRAVICRNGLALDLDTPEDLEQAVAAGFRFP
jgi:2-phospho-L-lactate guanylyltransferase